MELYEEYFDPELIQAPYQDEDEAVTDILALVDIHLIFAFYGKDIWEDRLDMRGVVITPKEVERALTDGSRVNRGGGQTDQEQSVLIKTNLDAAWRHIESRSSRTKAAGVSNRVTELSERYDLSEPEQLCLCLAVAVEYDRKYERLYGYLQDNVSVKLPTLGLGISLYQLGQRKTPAKVPEESPLWTFLLRPAGSAELQESRLSRTMALREDVYLWIREGLHDRQLGPCASYIKPVYGWKDLILEDSQKEMMSQICGRVQYRDLVMGTWGFGRKSAYGNGVSAIFYGPPGTGKTMAAQVIAAELGMDLYRVDLSQISSKYIGETEKNLSSLFEAAASRNAVLFFDEADGLFAKRSEVGSSNDRYANMETGFLLQKFEEYDGITILATNFIHNIDEAFKRRIKFMVRFLFPNEEMRLRLWESMLPTEAVLEEPLNMKLYARRFELSGSAIKDIITNAAYLAAARGHGIRNEDVHKALRFHYMRYGKNLEADELEEQ